MEEEIKNSVAQIIEAARAQEGASVVNVLEDLELQLDGIDAIPMVLAPIAGGGFELLSVKDEIDAWRNDYATKPRRRMGTAKLDEVDSFIEHANRFKDDNSVVFVSGGVQSPKFTSVLDYHEKGAIEEVDPRFGQHRGTYSPEFSPEWKAWKDANGTAMSQEKFANLINTNVRDVLDVDSRPEALAEAPLWFASRFGGGREPAEFYANASRLLALAEGLTVTMTDRVGDVSRRDSGETRITFESERSTDIEIPVAFVIEVPVFVGGDLWQIPVRLRFNVRTEGDTKRAQWRIEMFGTERTVLAVVAELREKVALGTSLPIFAGAPE